MSAQAFAIAAIAVAAAVFALLLRQTSPHMALLLSLITICVMLYRLLGALGTVLDYTRVLISLSGMSEAVIIPVLKSAAVVLIGGFSSSLCRDAGQSAVASMVDLSVNVSCMCLALPLVKLTVETVGELL